MLHTNSMHVRTAHGEERFRVNIGGNREWADAIMQAKLAARA